MIDHDTNSDTDEPTAFLCPSCNGRKVVLAHVNRGTSAPHTWEELACDTCGGTGSISPEQREARDLGRAIRLTRLATRSNLREMAGAIGVDFVELSKAENGRLGLDRTRAIHGLATGHAEDEGKGYDA